MNATELAAGVIGILTAEESRIRKVMVEAGVSVEEIEQRIERLKSGVLDRCEALESRDKEQASDAADNDLLVKYPQTFKREFVSREDSLRIEMIRSQTYELAKTDSSFIDPRTAMCCSFVADAEMARKYATRYFEKCIDLVNEPGNLDSTNIFATIIEGLERLSRELLLEPGEQPSDIGFNSDYPENLNKLGFTRSAEEDEAEEANRDLERRSLMEADRAAFAEATRRGESAHWELRVFPAFVIPLSEFTT